MGTESVEPLVAAIGSFAGLLIVLAFAVQRKRLIYRGIVSAVAAVATLVTTLSYVELASIRPGGLRLANAEPFIEKVATTQTACVRHGVVPACNCRGQ